MTSLTPAKRPPHPSSQSPQLIRWVSPRRRELRDATASRLAIPSTPRVGCGGRAGTPSWRACRRRLRAAAHRRGRGNPSRVPLHKIRAAANGRVRQPAPSGGWGPESSRARRVLRRQASHPGVPARPPHPTRFRAGPPASDAEAAALIVLGSLDEFLARVHDEGAIAGHRLAQRNAPREPESAPRCRWSRPRCCRRRSSTAACPVPTSRRQRRTCRAVVHVDETLCPGVRDSDVRERGSIRTSR
jgi:hypothetical protein